MGNLAFFAAADPFNPGAQLPGGAAPDVTTGQLGQVGITTKTPVRSPDHPFFWFALVAGVVIGLVGVSTHVRVGPFKAGVSASEPRRRREREE